MALLAGRMAVVTGGGSGIGRAIARRFAAEGAQVAVADLSREGAERVAAEVLADGGAAIAVPTDVADSAQVDALFARVVREWGTVDILSNNAGIGELSPRLRAQTEQAFQAIMGGARLSLGVTSRMDDAEWRRMLDVHLFGTFACTRAALRIMEERRRGALPGLGRGELRDRAGGEPERRLLHLTHPGTRPVLTRFARCAPPMSPDPAPAAAKPRPAL